MDSEWGLLKKIQQRITSWGMPFSTTPADHTYGDDAFYFLRDENEWGLVTTDMSVEDVHFNLSYMSASEIGCRIITGNLSDIYAMGGIPRFAFISLSLPPSLAESWVLEMYDGMLERAGQYNCAIAGGDITRGEKIVVSVSLYGEISDGQPILRSGANVGDTIYVTGTVGGSLAGLELLSKGSEQFPTLQLQHRCPSPDFSLSATILQKFSPTAMIDISDGLQSELFHLADQSRKGFRLDADSIPVPEELRQYAPDLSHRLHYALTSGEEYELLFTSPVHDSSIDGITPIGEITDEVYEIYLLDSVQSLTRERYDHFRREK